MAAKDTRKRRYAWGAYVSLLSHLSDCLERPGFSDLINRRDRGAWVWSEKHLHQLAYYPTTLYWDTMGSAINKMARALAALKVTKIVVNGTEPEARLLYRLLTMFGGQAVPPIEAWPLLRVEPMSL